MQNIIEDTMKAAEQGHADAQFRLGEAYRKGEGVPADKTEAVKWYRLAAEQGHANAQFILGYAYDVGKGVPEDKVEAAKWWRLAAEQGDADAQFRIKVVSVCGAGTNAVGAMIMAEFIGVEYVVADTDKQSLDRALADTKIQLEVNLTDGGDAGSKPQTGREAAPENFEEIRSALAGADMVFVIADMGRGGAGTVAGPVITRAALKTGALVIGVVTTPFTFESAHAQKIFEQDIRKLRNYTDSLIVIPSERHHLAGKTYCAAERFAVSDDALCAAVWGISTLVTQTETRMNMVGIDFADICSIMRQSGYAAMCMGQATGATRARDAAMQAIACPMPGNASLSEARSIFVNISSETQLKADELSEAMDIVLQAVSADVEVLLGVPLDDGFGDTLRVTVYAFGLEFTKKNVSDYSGLDKI
jgi:cell division protein FtsZ